MRCLLLAWAARYRYPRLVTEHGIIAAGLSSWYALVSIASDALCEAAWKRIAQWEQKRGKVA